VSSEGRGLFLLLSGLEKFMERYSGGRLSPPECSDEIDGDRGVVNSGEIGDLDNVCVVLSDTFLESLSGLGVVIGATSGMVRFIDGLAFEAGDCEGGVYVVVNTALGVFCGLFLSVGDLLGGLGVVLLSVRGFNEEPSLCHKSK
jgi:hypothetical protein